MKKIILVVFIAFCAGKAGAQYGEFDTARTIAPFKIFDNLYYVGNSSVSAYLVVCGNELVLIDALYGKYAGNILTACRQLGFDPKRIRYIICTHAHFDHAEGAAEIKATEGGTILMTDADWKIADGSVKAPYTSVNTVIPRDQTVHDDEILDVGGTTFHFFVTPGHTPGVLSFSFPVKDDGKTYKAFLFGGVGLNFEGTERTKMYIASVDRIAAMKGIEVNITNHPGPGKIFERAALLSARKPGNPHPFVAPGEFYDWLVSLRANAVKKLESERIKESNAKK